MIVLGEQQGEASIRSLSRELGFYGSIIIGVCSRVQLLAWSRL
jgi:hypothetical protein